MKPLLTQLDEQTLNALNHVAAPGKRQRSGFVGHALRRAEYSAMREAYREQPDSTQAADNWSTPD